MNSRMALALKLKGIKNEYARQELIRLWLEYHLPVGIKLDVRRPVYNCEDKHCSKPKEQCIMYRVVYNYGF